jgi:hypothetical protein
MMRATRLMLAAAKPAKAARRQKAAKLLSQAHA